jgi:RNA polymerase primary sigma factor
VLCAVRVPSFRRDFSFFVGNTSIVRPAIEAHGFVKGFMTNNPRKSSPATEADDISLVSRVLAGDLDAASEFMRIAHEPLWSVVVKIEGAGADGRAAFLNVVEKLHEDGYRLLKAFDGRARLSTYLALVAYELLAERAGKRLMEGSACSWAKLERILRSEIRRQIVQRFPRDTADHDDIYQEICVKLTADDFRCLRAYTGKGKFVRFVRKIVKNKLIDLIRDDVKRRRLPQAIARLQGLEQKIYEAVFWKGCAADTSRLVEFLRGPRSEENPDASAVRQALAHVLAAAPIPTTDAGERIELISFDALLSAGVGSAIADPALTPEDHLLLREEEQSRQALIAFIRVEAESLPADRRLYMQTVFDATEPLPPRMMARSWGAVRRMHPTFGNGRCVGVGAWPLTLQKAVPFRLW